MSKCDELKRYDIETDHGDTYEGVVAPDGFYMIADEVDEAVAEIKAENVRLKAENKGLKDENARLMSRPCYVCKEVNECVCVLAVVEVQDDDNHRYVTEADYVLEEGEIPEGVFYRPYIGDEIEENFEKAEGKRYISKVIMWSPMPEAPEEAK